MKKIGIITFHRSYNYGSVLQAYALQKKIKELAPEVSCEHIDYYPPNYKKMRSIFVPIKSVRNLVRNIIALIKLYPITNKRAKAFDNFVKENISLSKKSWYEVESIEEIDELYNIVIAGSDQIWNCTVSDFSPAYLFRKVKRAKKTSYAPSLGSGDFTKIKDSKCFDDLNSFSYISTREASGARRIEKYLKKPENTIPVVIDPTLLLNENEYENIISKEKIDGEYIFFYSVDQSNISLKIASEFAKKLNIPIISIYSSKSSIRLKTYGIKLSRKSSPSDFLSLIKNAKYVLTDSFHGTAFSVIFRKNFFSICHKNEKIRDSRINNLLSSINLQNRMLFIEEPLKKDLSIPVDFLSIESDLEEFKKSSIEYLNEIISLKE